jgi:hypothetical protein
MRSAIVLCNKPAIQRHARNLSSHDGIHASDSIVCLASAAQARRDDARLIIHVDSFKKKSSMLIVESQYSELGSTTGKYKEHREFENMGPQRKKGNILIVQ